MLTGDAEFAQRIKNEVEMASKMKQLAASELPI
jgi:hypothetical protein